MYPLCILLRVPSNRFLSLMDLFSTGIYAATPLALGLRSMWAFFALVAAVYTFMWDVKMDWGLWTPHAKYKGLCCINRPWCVKLIGRCRFLVYRWSQVCVQCCVCWMVIGFFFMRPSSALYLVLLFALYLCKMCYLNSLTRSDQWLAHKSCCAVWLQVYYISIVADFFMRFAWVLSLTPIQPLINPDMWLVLVGLIELLRCVCDYLFFFLFLAESLSRYPPFFYFFLAPSSLHSFP